MHLHCERDVLDESRREDSGCCGRRTDLNQSPPGCKVGEGVRFGVERVPVQRDNVGIREQQKEVLERFRLRRRTMRQASASAFPLPFKRRHCFDEGSSRSRTSPCGLRE